MLSTELSYEFVALALLLVLFAIVFYRWMRKLAAYCTEAVQVVQNQNANSVKLRQIADLSAEMTDLRDSFDSLLKQHKKLRARYTMRERRSNGKTDESGLHSTDKTEVRKAAKAAGLLNS